MHTALEIARYIINKCIELGRPVSNLQLQKILYYLQGEYIRQNNGELLFKDSIEAWQYGPVVPSVYYSYNYNSSNPIALKQQEMELLENEKKIINPIITELSNETAWNLVQRTHLESPWKDSYEEGKKNMISNECLRDHFMHL